MKLDEAIEILSDSAHLGMTTFNQDYKDALKLGIEALKRLRQEKDEIPDTLWNPLPGETDT